MGASSHEYVPMRTTIDLPDELYRSLKARAALSGTTLRVLIVDLVERGLRSPDRASTQATRWGPPPVVVPPRGRPIEAVPSARLREIEEEEDAARVAGRP